MANAADDKSTNMALVVTASTAGTAFEWYDFFLFVPLTTILSKVFFSGLDDTSAFIFALGSFAVGFAFRPVGALIFGRVGDRIGRKATFLITMALMGLSTFAVALLPSYAQVGILSPVLFISLRILQGMAIGGEWGGAAIYIVEHEQPHRRALTSSWLGGSAAFGLFFALLAVWVVRKAMGQSGLEAWGWRLPFLFSALLLGVSVWIRLRLNESPVFARMKAEGRRSTQPYKDSFGNWDGIKRALIALFAVMIAQGAVWYCVFFYASTFLEKTVKVDPAVINQVMMALTVVSIPMYIFFGWLSDRIGRKPVMLGGLILMLAIYFPAFHALETYGNPAMAAAIKAQPVTITADPSDCSVQFDPVGKKVFKTGCDILKSTLAGAGVSYQNQKAAGGTLASVQIGNTVIQSIEGRSLDKDDLAGAKKVIASKVGAALKAAGYPAKADPAGTNPVALFLILLGMTVGATALYGPQAAALVEMFPAKVRYTALSLPYHIGTGWVGGFLPATAVAIVAQTGNIFSGVWYAFGFTALAAACMLLLFKETRGADLEA
jgi:MFS family permease